MRVGWTLAGILVATAACGSSSAASGSGPATSARAVIVCGPHRADTVAANPSARVYRLGRSVYGCAKGARRGYLLGADPARIGQSRIGPIALAGKDAAYGLTSMGVDTSSAEVVVRRLDSGQTLHTLNATTEALGPESLQAVGSVAVKSDGAVAWIGLASSIIRHSTQVEVDRADRRGETTLDSGTAIGRRSLRLRGSQLSWRHGQARRSATLD